MHECTCICVYVMSVRTYICVCMSVRVYMCMHECTCIYVYA